MMDSKAAQGPGQTETSNASAAHLGSALMAAGAGLLVLLYGFGGRDRPDEPYATANRAPTIWPDCGDIVIPPNIAPLNFAIHEPGTCYFVRVHAANGKPIEVLSRKRQIRIPQRPWRRILEENRGGTLNLDVFVKSAAADRTARPPARWHRFARVTSRIAPEDVDNFIVYRRIWPGHATWRQMGVYQRDLRSYDEDVILDNDYFQHGCVNCHAFCNHRTRKMLLGVRSTTYGSSAILAEDGHVSKIGTRLGYTSWHPSGSVAASSVNKVRQVFHSAANEIRDVLDFDSLIACYRLDDRTVRTAPALARKDWLETYPAWSPDGQYLYFCCAPITWKDRDSVPDNFHQIRYSLVRIRYDLQKDQWGDLETVLSADQTGQSILLPRISPDGRWLLFTMCDYGCFPVYRQSADLYMMDLEMAQQTGQYSYRRLDINSDASESWHSWSSNGRWIAFSSKRLSHLFTRLYLAYVDDRGAAHKPFLLPQQNPHSYDACLWTFSVPELVTKPVRTRGETLARAIRGKHEIPVEMPVTMATPRQEATAAQEESWHQ